MELKSSYPVICTDKILESKSFYTRLFNFEPTFVDDWYVSLRSKSNPEYELAFLDSTHPSLPEAYRVKSSGTLLNLEVEDVRSEYERLKNEELNIVLPLREEQWGQIHFILEDPNGILIDIIENIEAGEEFKEAYSQE